ncbi:TPA: hypothetical protein ACS9WW_004218 [Salmonella enterica subsp. enterica serovar Muenchen]
MLTRKSIDTILLSVAADKLSQCEWDKLMKTMNPPQAMVASAILENRHDVAVFDRLQYAGN